MLNKKDLDSTIEILYAGAESAVQRHIFAIHLIMSVLTLTPILGKSRVEAVTDILNKAQAQVI